MAFSPYKLSSILLSLGMIFLLLGSFFAISQMNMDMQMDGQMSNCSFMINGVICAMTSLEHIAAIQNLFAALPQLQTLLLLLGVYLSVLAILFTKKGPSSPHLTRAHTKNRGQDFFPASNLQQAFSSGILHPKLF